MQCVMQCVKVSVFFCIVVGVLMAPAPTSNDMQTLLNKWAKEAKEARGKKEICMIIIFVGSL